MKLLMLVCLGLMLSLVVAKQSACERPSMSVLTPPIVPHDCDVCEQLENDDTDFWNKCGKFLDQMIIDKLVADCKRIVKTKKKTQIKWFWETLKLTCKVKTGLGPFKELICECDPCDELAKEGSEFMMKCAYSMTECDRIERLRMCRQVKGDYEQLWYFYKDLKADCLALTGENITVPICNCDVCWLLFNEDSDFMQKCGGDMDQIMLDKMFQTCENVVCDPVELGFFKMNLELVCEKKGKGPFKFPECVCEECWKLFQTDSAFMEKCGSAMSPIMRMELMKSCYANMDSLDHFMTFLDNLELVCYKKSGEYFEKEWCYCKECLLLEDPTEEIVKECLMGMPDWHRAMCREQCFNASKDPVDFEIYKQEVLDFCYTVKHVNVSFPKCGGECNRQDLCLAIAIDSSGSIDTVEFDSELDFVSKLITSFGDNLGPNKTSIGIGQFGSNYLPIIEMCPTGPDQAAAQAALNSVVKLGGGTATGEALTAIKFSLDYCCPAGHTKYGFVLTDGLHYGGVFDYNTAVHSIPSDVTMFAIGIGINANEAELLEIAQGIEDNKYHVDDVTELESLIEDLKTSIGC